MKQTRYISANYKKKFYSSAHFFEFMAGQLAGRCECGGKGCTVCISADALNEAVQLIRIMEAKLNE